MAEVKNSFLSSKMNKDLDDRLIPNGEYRNAVNISINKSTGENVGTAQTVLGNEQTIDFSASLNAASLEVIGVFPDEASNTIYAVLTNNIIDPYVPTGAVGNNVTYPNNQSSITNGPIEITVAGATYTNEIDGTTTAVSGSGTGLTVSVTVDSNGAITEAIIQTFGSGYAVNDVVQINGGDSAARLTIKSLLPNDHFIVAYNITTTNLVTIVQGSFLNFSTLYPITGINLLEELLFFTDNRNQPRKINITRTPPYYTTEDQISVAKYYPYETIELYQPSSITGAIVQTESINAVSNSDVITFNPAASGAAPTISLGVTGIAATLLAAGQGYATAASVPVEGGSGAGLLIQILTVSASGQGIATFQIVNEGVGYVTGDIVTVVQGSSSNTAELTISVVKENTFITDVTNWPNSITVNQTQDLPAGMSIKLSEPETTMQDAISEYLPVEANAGGTNAFSINSPTTFRVTIESYVGSSEIIGSNIFLRNSSGNYINSNITVVSKTTSGTEFVIQASSPLDDPSSPVAGEYVTNAVVRFAIPNPYFNQVFKDNANIDFLSDKFVRFSYRYRFDDGEYSLMAPFTQPCFIPEQDGYFIGADINGDGVSDTEKAYRSTEVSFMENKVNKILLNIPLPSSASSLSSSFKVTEIDILYKESDQTTIKVVDSVPLLNNVQGTSDYYQYEYGSKPPFKTLPQSDTVRVFDKIPVKAVSQEIASNRVIYGNFQDKHTPPSFLNYTLAAGAKGVVGATVDPKFTISNNKVTNYTSLVEYPNASLKENRTYEVGVVLADRFGRQSTVIFSRTKLSLLPSFIASSRYSPYRSLGDNEVTSTNPSGGILNFDGDSLKIQFIDIINSFKNQTTGVPGLYNGNANSQDYNPLGWYSFKIVVKQTEQDYYNVYIPMAMAAYPLDRTKEINTTSHIVLYNDNINKIPRDLQEVGPTQKEFPSSVRMFGRVNNPDNISTISQFYPGRAASLSTTIATIKDLFDFKEFPDLEGISNNPYIFYNYDYTGGASTSTPPVLGSVTTSDGSSLVARIESSNDTKFGQQVPPAGYYSGKPKLNVFETAPTISNLDIYYETSTAGRIDLLNKAIAEGPAANIFTTLTYFTFILNEGFIGRNADPANPASFINNTRCTTPFQPINFNGAALGVASENECEILSVVNQNGSETNENGVPYLANPSTGVSSDGIFGVERVLDSTGTATGKFRIVLTKAGLADGGTTVATTPGLVVAGGNGNTGSYTYTFVLKFENPAAADPFIFEFTERLKNRPPPSTCPSPTPANGIQVIDIDANKSYPCCCPGDIPPGSSGCNPVEIPPTVFDLADGLTGPLFGVTCENGSGTDSLDRLDMTFSITSLIETTVSGLDIVYDTLAEIEQRFIITQGPGPAGFPALSNQQAVISVPQFNLLQNNIKYVLTIRACDGGTDNLCEFCDITFRFLEQPVVIFDDGAATIVPAPPTPPPILPGGVLSNRYSYDICGGRYWSPIGGEGSIPGTAQSMLYFPINVQTLYADVKFRLEGVLYNSATTAEVVIPGDIAINIVFAEGGYDAEPLQVFNDNAAGVYAEPPDSIPIVGSNGIKHVISGPTTIPANGVVNFTSTSTLRLNVTEDNQGWGSQGSGDVTNVGMNVFIGGFGGDEYCFGNTKKPVVEVRLRAMVP